MTCSADFPVCFFLRVALCGLRACGLVRFCHQKHPSSVSVRELCCLFPFMFTHRLHTDSLVDALFARGYRISSYGEDRGSAALLLVHFPSGPFPVRAYDAVVRGDGCGSPVRVCRCCPNELRPSMRLLLPSVTSFAQPCLLAACATI